jgi:hypothetical protein
VNLFAYIDPGSGSLVIQALIAAVVAIPFFFRTQIGRLVRVVRGEDDRREATATTGRSGDDRRHDR